MERLTKRCGIISAVPVVFDLDFVFELDDHTWRGLQKVFDRLADYEDTGMTPDEIHTMKNVIETRFIKHMERKYGHSAAEILDMYEAAKEGRVMVLPCPIGTPVFVHEAVCTEGKRITFEGCKYSQDCIKSRSIKCPLRVVKRAFTVNMRKELGLTFWLTKKEAEDAIPADRRP